MGNNGIVSLRNITKCYKTNDKEKNVLNGLRLDISRGEFVAIRGTSGSGKSTLMNIIGLLDYPDSGEYIFDGTKVCVKNKNVSNYLRGNRIGFIFQSYNLIENLSVLDNILMPFMYSTTKLGKDTLKYVDDILEMLNILELKNKSSKLLSGGEKQRVAIARAIVKNPDLIIADEPTGNLDNNNAQLINDIFNNIKKKNTSIVVVTHSNQIFMDVDNSYELKEGVLK